ncbi:MAG: hypothetical protein LLG01_15755 [Planctomycetaceae bacterium]|nr:hypothetical protein [Planctomycetaceae bacterium]
MRVRVKERTLKDQREIARRLRVYVDQVDRCGRITRWQPNVMNPKVRDDRYVPEPSKEDD